MEDWDMRILFGAVLGTLLLVAVSMMVSDWYSHSERMKCIEMRGEWIGKTCIFRVVPPVEQIIVPKVYYRL